MSAPAAIFARVSSASLRAASESRFLVSNRICVTTSCSGVAYFARSATYSSRARAS